MNKKAYQTPTMEVEKMQDQCPILAGSSYETSGQGRTSITEMGNEEDL